MSGQDAELRRLIEQRTREWDQRFQQMQQEIAQKDELLAQERQRIDMMSYIQRRIAEEADEIAPELIDYIGGSTPEEVEAAITAAKAKTASILDGVRQAMSVSADVQVPGVPAHPGTSAPAGFPGQAQAQQPRGGQQRPSAEDIAAVEPGSPAHQALRHQFGIDRARGRGLFG